MKARQLLIADVRLQDGSARGSINNQEINNQQLSAGVQFSQRHLAGGFPCLFTTTFASIVINPSNWF